MIWICVGTKFLDTVAKAKGDKQDQAEYALKGFGEHHILALF